MAILKEHIPFYREILKLPSVLSEPFLMFGYQDIVGSNIPEDFRFKDVKELLISKGVKDIKTLDFFDTRADLKYDMNVPIPQNENEKYRVLLDIGCLEHLFDTRQCIENCLRMIKPDGLYILHTAVNGYYRHGLHVFNPEGIIEVLRLNNFEIIHLKYSTKDGILLKDPSSGEDVLIWVVSKKLKSIDKFIIPQQKMWWEVRQNENIEDARFSMKHTIRDVLSVGWKLLKNLRYRIMRFLD